MLSLNANNDSILFWNHTEVFFGKPFPALFHNWQGGDTLSSGNNFTVQPVTGKITTMLGLDFSGAIYTDTAYRASGGIAAGSLANSWFSMTPANRGLRVGPDYNVATNAPASWTFTNQVLNHREILPTHLTRVSSGKMIINHKFYETTGSAWGWQSTKRWRHNGISIVLTVKSVNPVTLSVTTHGTTTETVWARDTTGGNASFPTNYSTVVTLATDIIEGNILFIDYTYTASQIIIENTTTGAYWNDTVFFIFWQSFTDVNQFYNQIIV